jgi:hypothetical protein
MQQIPTEVVVVHQASTLVWVLVLGIILIAGRWWLRAHEFRDTMLWQWKASLVITLLYMLGPGIGGWASSPSARFGSFVRR